MEATATATTTGSRTIADLIPRAAAAHADHTAVRYKRDGAWHDVSYSQLAEIVQEIGLGLIELGIRPGERVCILANTRPEWSYADMGATSAGAVVASYTVTMSDGSPFVGTVGFGAPNFDAGGIFALRGSPASGNVIVSPTGPGVGPNLGTITDHITLIATKP